MNVTQRKAKTNLITKKRTNQKICKTDQIRSLEVRKATEATF